MNKIRPEHEPYNRAHDNKFGRSKHFHQIIYRLEVWANGEAHKNEFSASQRTICYDRGAKSGPPIPKLHSPRGLPRWVQYVAMTWMGLKSRVKHVAWVVGTQDSYGHLVGRKGHGGWPSIERTRQNRFWPFRVPEGQSSWAIIPPSHTPTTSWQWEFVPKIAQILWKRFVQSERGYVQSRDRTLSDCEFQSLLATRDWSTQYPQQLISLLAANSPHNLIYVLQLV